MHPHLSLSFLNSASDEENWSSGVAGTDTPKKIGGEIWKGFLTTKTKHSLNACNLLVSHLKPEQHS
ncbi:hypothetical protein DVH24_035811 [Malus domestica]|uniref:Uncharacterized protein n=1 Tax=Malus domestica TaxID=3750 RepID=A0A498JT94_MALDO|nr:hypothetical protein DVH24_035811 [Malus domestica]